MRAWKAPIILTLIILSGCFRRPQINWTNPAETQGRVQITQDDFKKITNYKGPNIEKLDQGHYDKVFIRAWRAQKDKKTSYQIYVSDTYSNFYTGGSWKSLSEAYDSNGTKFDLIKIDTDVSCGRHYCQHTEDVGLNVSRKYLEEHIASGISFQISGTGGKEVFEVPGGYMKGFLASVPE